jgi:two-component system chemotaxis response regulator CheY
MSGNIFREESQNGQELDRIRLGEDLPGRGRGMTKTVLTVDDSRTMRDMLRIALIDAGFDVVQAEDGVHGLELLQGTRPDVIITDINMPRMDGYGFMQGVRADAQSRAIPILVLTTESSPEKKLRARDAGATGWIVKPFDPQKLVDAINRVAA